MKTMQSVLLATTIFWPGLALAQAEFPDYYPDNYAEIVAAAKEEGKVVVYSPLDASAARALVDDFQSMYPGITVEYNDLSTPVLNNRFISEAAAGQTTADVVWSSAMDLQMQLVKDGNALEYASAELPRLPAWASFESKAYGTTFEPIVFIYNKAELTEDMVPKSHAEIPAKFQENADILDGRVISYDIEGSGIGFLTVATDSKMSESFWDIPTAMGSVNTRYVAGSGQMIDSVAAGESVFAYNQIASYARRQADNPDMGVIFPSDYTLVISRVAFVAADAPHPNAGKLWLDYMLSQRGQTVLAGEGGLYSLRDDVEGDYSAASLTAAHGDVLRPVPINLDILQNLDRTFADDFLAKWKAANRGQ